MAARAGRFDNDDEPGGFDPEQAELAELEDMPSSDREELQRSPHLAYIVLYAQDVDELADFYEGTFGFERIYESGETVELQAGAVRLTLTDVSDLVEVVGLTATPSPHEERVSLSFFVEDVDRVFDAAIELGGEAIREPHETAWGTRSAFVRDPAGHLLEIGRRLHPGH